jgi:NAD dependent epimerase/dehydratase
MLENSFVLVTGADGFIGSHLVALLHQRGAKVRALAQYNSFNSWGWLEDEQCLPDIEVVTGDVRDPYFCRKIVQGIDVIFNLAALIAIPYSYSAPDSYIDTNIKGALNICQAARDQGVQRVMQTSTSEVYGTARYVPIDEAHPMQPQSPYSASKIGADALAMSFYHAFGLPVTIARPFNTYGPRQSARAVIPTIISQIASGEKLIRLGDTRPTRDFNFVTDTCRGMMLLAECEAAVGETVNIGSNREISVGGLFELIRELMGSDAQLFQEEERLRPAGSEVMRLVCDNSKIRRLTGFEPEVSLREGLMRSIDWFREPANLQRYKTGVYNV